MRGFVKQIDLEIEEFLTFTHVYSEYIDSSHFSLPMYWAEAFQEKIMAPRKIIMYVISTVSYLLRNVIKIDAFTLANYHTCHWK